jgi:hypothetical protein
MDPAEFTNCRMVGYTAPKKRRCLSQHVKQIQTAEIRPEVCEKVTAKEAQTSVERIL